MAKVHDTRENMAKCICGECPSYDGCMKNGTESLYCARGKSACEVAQKGCVCGVCPIAPEFGLAKMYYCESGAEE